VPLSFGIIHVEGLRPEGIATAQQTALPGGDDQVTTRVDVDPNWAHTAYRKYNVTHESTLRLEGRYRNEPINEVIEVHHFDLYASKVSDMVIARAPKKLLREALNRLHKQDHHPFNYHVDELDMTKLGGALGAPIAGGWFGQLKIARVRTVGIFGADVADSEEWDHYRQSGTLQAIIVELEFDDNPLQLMLVRDSTIVLYRDLGEVANLAFINQIQTAISDALRAGEEQDS